MKKVLIFLVLICACFLASGVFAVDTVDINTASLAQLDTLTGIGPTYAQRIIDGRPYSSLDDLLNVKGIGPATLQKIKDQGLACVNCETSPTNTQSNLDSSAPPTAATAQTYSSGVYINEIVPNPAGSDEQEEFIEIFNSNSSDVDLSGWQLQDRAGTITTYTIPSVTKIMAGGFLIFKRPDTKIMLNNDGDGVNLLTPNGKITDSVGFLNAPLGQSYSRTSKDWAWSTTLTPAAANVVAAAVTVEKTLPKTQKSDTNSNIEAKDLTASLSLPIASGTNPWFLFFTTLGITIILSIIVLIIKFKLNKHVRT